MSSIAPSQKSKSKTARILFILVGCIFPIFIGTIHTATHFSQLVTSEIKQFLQEEFIILGQSQSLWNTWGIVSFMMGASFIIIGLLNISTVTKLSKTDYPPTISIVALILYQLSVIYVGYEFKQGFQLYGGLFGLVVIIVCFILTLQSNKPKA